MARPFKAIENHLEKQEGIQAALGTCLVRIELVQMRLRRATEMTRRYELLDPASEDLNEVARSIKRVQSVIPTIGAGAAR